MSECTHRALIVEDDDDIVDVIVDHIESLGHAYDRAANQAEARELFTHNKYCYVLLDLEIPVKAMRIGRVEHGVNFLEEIRRGTEGCRTQVIIMTSHGTDGPYLAVDVMKKGADDYICKPFAAEPGERTPGDVIKEALQHGCKHAPEHCPLLGETPSTESDAPSAQPEGFTPFAGGQLVFHGTHVELLGHTILTARAKKSWRVLRLLARRKASGEYVAYSADDLIEKLGLKRERGQNDAAGYIKYLRDRVESILRKHGVRCGRQDVIESGGRGYRLNPRIEVEGIDS